MCHQGSSQHLGEAEAVGTEVPGPLPSHAVMPCSPPAVPAVHIPVLLQAALHRGRLCGSHSNRAASLLHLSQHG